MPRQKSMDENRSRAIRAYLILEVCSRKPKAQYQIERILAAISKDQNLKIGSGKTVARHLKRLIAAGALIVAGTRPGKRGLKECRIPLYATSPVGKQLLDGVTSNFESGLKLLDSMKKPCSTDPFI